ncbi:MAG: hypothetical protein AAFR36_24895 [Bacteroidota bacterium]
MKTKFTTAIFCFLFLASASSAQLLSSEEVENAIAMMRKSGTPEATIQQFIESSQQAMKIQEELQAIQNGDTPRDGSLIPNENATALGNLFENFAAVGVATEARQLQAEIDEFIALHGEKPDFVVFIGDQVYSMKLLDCKRDGGTFQIHLESLPDTAGERGPALYASRSGPFAGGDGGNLVYLERLRFASSDYNVSAGDKSGTFSGTTFSFDGMSAVVSNNEDPVRMRVEVTC